MKTLQAVWTKAKPVIEKVLLVAFFLFCGAALLKTCQVISKKEPQQSATLQVKPTTFYVDNQGNTHQVIVANQLSKQEMEHLTDSIRKTIKGTPQIKEVFVFVPQIDTFWKELPVTIKGDTIETSKIDSYVNARAIINTKTKQGFISLKLTDTLTQVRTFKNRFLGANTSTIDITNKNPYVKVVAGSAVIVKEPKTLLVFGPSIVYNPFNQKVQYGVGITFNVLAIKSKK